jgi:hypothetical protein
MAHTPNTQLKLISVNDTAESTDIHVNFYNLLRLSFFKGIIKPKSRKCELCYPRPFR